MRVLLWHVHGSWTEAFVRGGHEYLLPTLPEGGPWGLGRGGRDYWPRNAVEYTPEQLRHTDVDAIVVQRPEELDEAERLLGRRPGHDLPAVYVEHNTPRTAVPDTRHPLAERSDIVLVHVTHFNDLMWDSGLAPTRVIEHGVVDPGTRYTGELARAAAVINEPVRRWRVTGTDLLPAFATAAPIDVFGMGLERLHAELGMDAGQLDALGDLRPGRLHTELGRRRVYLHTARWTSLGLSLLEAMHLGMPVVVLGTTEAPVAVPADAGVVSTNVATLATETRRLMHEPGLAAQLGKRAREFALSHYGLEGFLRNWDTLLAELTA